MGLAGRQGVAWRHVKFVSESLGHESLPQPFLYSNTRSGMLPQKGTRRSLILRLLLPRHKALNPF